MGTNRPQGQTQGKETGRRFSDTERRPVCVCECLFRVSGVEDEARPLFQPPAGILPTPVYLLRGAAVGKSDPFGVNLHHHNDMTAILVVILDQITGADLLPARVGCLPLGQVPEDSVGAQDGPACTVAVADTVWSTTVGDVRAGIDGPGWVLFPQLG